MAHKFPPWRRAILVPFWTLQLLFMVIMIGLLALSKVVFKNYYDPNKDYGLNGSDDAALDNAVHVTSKYLIPIWISLSVFCAILTITEIILLTRRKLTPLKFLIFNVVKSAIWTGLFILDIIGWVNSSGNGVTAFGIAVEVAIVLSFWIPLIYGSIVFHKNRKGRGIYKPIGPVGTHDTSYPSQLQRHDIETGPPAYHGQVSGTTGGAYDPYKPGGQHGDIGLAHVQPNTPGLMSPPVPQVYVQHHDVYEMDSRRNLS